MIDNIIIGTPICSDAELGILETEETIRFTFEELQDDKGVVFLPRVLVKLNMFKSTSQVRNINEQREKVATIKDPDARNLWRELSQLEMTEFKIGKQKFWLIVGERNK